MRNGDNNRRWTYQGVGKESGQGRVVTWLADGGVGRRTWELWGSARMGWISEENRRWTYEGVEGRMDGRGGWKGEWTWEGEGRFLGRSAIDKMTEDRLSQWEQHSGAGDFIA